MQDTVISFEQAKNAYVKLYGEFYNEQEFDNFNTAFKSAWDSFDFISNAEEDEYQFAEGMTKCWQLTQFE